MVTQTASYFGPESKAKLLLGKGAEILVTLLRPLRMEIN